MSLSTLNVDNVLLEPSFLKYTVLDHVLGLKKMIKTQLRRTAPQAETPLVLKAYGLKVPFLDFSVGLLQ